MMLDPRAEIHIPPDYYDHDDGENVCYLCGAPAYSPWSQPDRYGFPVVFKRCQCRLGKQVPMPNKRFFEWFFSSDVFLSSKESGKSEIWGFYDFFGDEPCRLATSRRRYRALSRHFPKGRSLEMLKIGPATGTFLHVARQNGHRTRGCDLSTRFVEYARNTYGVEIDHGRFEDIGYANGQFDVILLFNVIENIPNPAEFLERVRQTLRPRGLFILNFVDMQCNLIAAMQKDRYFLFRPPVCYVYDLPVMKRVLGKFGFEMVALHRDIRFMHLEKIATLLRWRWILGAAKAAGIAHVKFPFYAYPSRIVVARKA